MSTNHKYNIEEKSAIDIEKLGLRVDGHQVHYLQAGEGPPVMLMHGAASTSRDWLETINSLSHSYKLYAPDTVGFGLSDRARDSYHISDFAEFSLEFISKMGLESPSLVGHSLGGRICLEIAFRHPELIHRLVLIDTAGFSKLSRWGLSLGAAAHWIRKISRTMQPYPDFLMEEEEDKHWLCTDRLSELKVPTLIIWNRRDPYYSLSGAIKANNLIPQSRLEILPGYGHTPHLQYADQFNSLLLDFLNEDPE